MKDIILAGGCFWGVEAYFKLIEGVLITKVGYANGNTSTTTYEEVCTGTTGHAEVVYITYNPKCVTLLQILNAYFKIIDPTIKNRQGGDIGTQYRTGIYYTDTDDLPIILSKIEDEQKKYDAPIVTEVKLLKNFCVAESYHQDYLSKNPNGYCHIDLSIKPKAGEFNDSI